jgi:hypothetical protein
LKVLVFCLIAGVACAGPAPASSRQQATAKTFGNAWIGASWSIDNRHLADLLIHDKVNHVDIKETAPFKLIMDDGSTYGIKNMRLLSAPVESRIKADPGTSRLAEHFPGRAIKARFGDKAGHFNVIWRLVQRKGSHYLREIVTIKALKQDAKIRKVKLMNVSVPDAHVVGTVKGSPVVANHDYFGFEQPMSKSNAWNGKASFWMERTLPLRKGKRVTYSAVAGETYANQLRRGFAKYIERERAHPYRPFLHYNSWYDIGAFTQYTQKQALNRINAFGKQLVEKRGVKMDSFLFDAGWDDYSGSWNFSKYFPHGFIPLKKAAAKYGAAPGVWLSPWGGYGKPHDERVRNGRKAGYGIVDDGLALSAPKYWKRFHHVVMNMLDKQGINQFKLDGTGNVNSVYPGSQFDSDFAAAIQLIKDIRADKPDTFINLTTGTWASPFWLRYVDSIWRGGYDHSFTGVGTKREQWITYRDEQTYRNIVEKGPLFPLNSLMLHGIIYARHARGLNTEPGHDFANGVHDFFATGTDLQELYITPSLMTSHDWDILAEAAKWSRANSSVLEDTHWIGGDPGRLQVYGWAAWTPKKAFVTFRNPDNKPQLAVVDLRKQLELPTSAASHFLVKDVWHTGGGGVPAQLDAGHLTTIRLKPFEVLTLALTPEKGS